jgi:hypothetical protein
MSSSLTGLALSLTSVLQLDSIRVRCQGDGMRKTETLNLRVSPEFKRRLMEEAKKEKRSVTNYLEVTLADLWKGKTPPKAAKRGARNADIPH